MDLFLDGKRMELRNIGAKTLGELVQQMNEDPLQRFVASVEIDGKSLSGWDSISLSSLSPCATVAIETQSVRQLLLETSRSCLDYLPHLTTASVSAAELFHEGREDDALATISDILEGLQWYADFLSNAASLLPSKDQAASFRLSFLNGILQKLLQTWETKNFTLLADILEYELVPELDLGMEYVAQVSKELISN